jgi:HEAT repeat protein
MKKNRISDDPGSCRITGGSANALYRFRQPLVSYLLSGLEDDDTWVRALAAEMLGTLRDPQAISLLTRLLADPDVDVRTASAGALDAIGHSHLAFVNLQKSGCDTCLLRIIAQEALSAEPAGG